MISFFTSKLFIILYIIFQVSTAYIDDEFERPIQLELISSNSPDQIQWIENQSYEFEFRISLPLLYKSSSRKPSLTILPTLPNLPLWATTRYWFDSIVLMEKPQLDVDLIQGISSGTFFNNYMEYGSKKSSNLILKDFNVMCQRMVTIFGKYEVILQCSMRVRVPNVPQTLSGKNFNLGLVFASKSAIPVEEFDSIDPNMSTDDNTNLRVAFFGESKVLLLNQMPGYFFPSSSHKDILDFTEYQDSNNMRKAVFNAITTLGISVDRLTSSDIEITGISPTEVLPQGLFATKSINLSDMNDEELEEQCATCLSKFMDDKTENSGTLNYNPRVLITSCGPRGKLNGHYFHEECVSKWLSSHSSCPICRKFAFLP